MNDHTKTAFIAIVGKPNVGKSSLLNALLGEKLAIVTHKPQTTRTRILGVLTDQHNQYVFLDTPGLHQAKNKLGKNMVKAVKDSLLDIDLVLLVVDANGKVSPAERSLIDLVKQRDLASVLVINKIDLLRGKAEVAACITEFTALHDFDAVIPISVLQQDGISLVRHQIAQYLKTGTHFFPQDTLTDQPERVIVAERIREKILIHMQEEIPHGIAIVVETMKERTHQNMLDIDAVIYCERKSHKGMLIGKNGSMLKRIGSEARQDLETFFQIHINLQCWVKIKEDWRNQDRLIENFGLSYNP